MDDSWLIFLWRHQTKTAISAGRFPCTSKALDSFPHQDVAEYSIAHVLWRLSCSLVSTKSDDCFAFRLKNVQCLVKWHTFSCSPDRNPSVDPSVYRITEIKGAVGRCTIASEFMLSSATFLHFVTEDKCAAPGCLQYLLLISPPEFAGRVFCLRAP